MKRYNLTFRRPFTILLLLLFFRFGSPRLTASTTRKHNHHSVTTVSNATLRIPLFSRSGTHHLQLYVGQPPVPRTLIVDTGSRLTAWTCSPCPSCDANNNKKKKKKNRKHYDPEKSTTSSVSLIAANVTTPLDCISSSSASASSCHFSDVSVCSSTTKNRCFLEQRYTEGSTWEAYEVTDMITLGGIVPNTNNNNNNEVTNVVGAADDYETSLPYATLPFTFGCQTSLSGLFKEQYADGILGLEHSSYSLMAALQSTGVLEDFTKNHRRRQAADDHTQKKKDMSFSLCLTPTGGWMGLGGSIVERHLEPMRTTTLVKTTARARSSKSKGMYAIKVAAVWLGDLCVTCGTKKRSQKEILDAFNGDKGTIMDSGTTDTYFPGFLGPIWEYAWSNLTGYSWNDENREMFLTEAERDRFPTVRVVLAHNVTLAIPPEHYMEIEEDKRGRPRTRGKKKMWSNRIYVDEPDGAVLGINAMLGHDIVFDWENGFVGVAPADCSSKTNRLQPPEA